jgi:hypothetical protein
VVNEELKAGSELKGWAFRSMALQPEGCRVVRRGKEELELALDVDPKNGSRI